MILSAVRLLRTMRGSSTLAWIPRMRYRFSLPLAALSAAVILASGCAEQKRPAIRWGAAVLVRPTMVRPLPETAEQMAAAEPDMQVEIPAAIPPLLLGRTVPARPRGAASSSSTSSSPTEADPPQIVPQLTSQQSTSLQRETEQSLREAERNLAAMAGKSMNAAQTDLASKVRSFIAEAREAGRAGDWARAQAVAKKAQVLSEELVGSL